jgi:alpha-L-rhamnosidase
LCSDITAKTANILNSPADAKHYAALAGQTRHGFHKRFYDAGKGTYGFAGGNVFALKMQLPFEETEKARVVAALRHDILTDASKCAGLTEQSRVAFKGGYVACRNMAAKYGIPSDTVEREHVLARLKKEFSANGGHIDVGFIGTQLFFEVLAENGLNEVAFGAMNKRDIPSFGWWIDQGATTFWERWDGEAAIDLPMFGGSITWFYRKLAGFNADESQPGYRHIIVRPEPVADIAYAKYSTRTPYGYASVYWRKEAASLAMEVKVPVGSTATVYVPLMTKSKTIKGDIVAKNKMKYADYRGTAEGYAIYSVKSGIYKFYAD